MITQPTKEELLEQLKQISQELKVLFVDFQKRLEDLELRKKRLISTAQKRIKNESIKKILMNIK